MQRSENFANTILSFRAENDLTQAEAAEVLGVHLNSIGYYERGECFPTQKNRVKILQALKKYNYAKKQHSKEEV